MIIPVVVARLWKDGTWDTHELDIESNFDMDSIQEKSIDMEWRWLRLVGENENCDRVVLYNVISGD